MIALGGPKLKPHGHSSAIVDGSVSMIALGGPKLKLVEGSGDVASAPRFNDSTGWA